MIIKLGTKRKKDLNKWHRWFAWYPVITLHEELVWLTRIERKRTFSYMDSCNHYEYRVEERIVD